MSINVRIVNPCQKAEKFPATKPDSMLREAPPCLEALTTSSQCFDLVLVKIFVNSGISAPAIVPQLIIIDNDHQSDSREPSRFPNNK